MIRLDGQLGPDDFFDTSGPVGYNAEGGNELSLTHPDTPYLDEGDVAIYEDILGGKNLAPIGGIGSDTDSSDWRAIQIAWNFGADPDTVNEYHVYVSVDGGNFELLGQTLSGTINYFWWTSTEEFRTNSTYADGPQGGHTYQFKIFLLPFEGQTQSLISGTLMYEVEE